MTTLTIKKIIELGGNEWNKGDMHRVYISFKLINKITDDLVSGLNAKKWKFYADVKTGDIYRTCGKKPVLVTNIAKL